ncbi:MAG: hypothetical protein LBT90_03440 [Holosporaceae bacterium]|jgi:hypothetical protein|nr:hypothetical protein [Holosporaceae bacterium]
MNKVVVILGIIVLITLAGLFFCVGFFTGTSSFAEKAAQTLKMEAQKEPKLNSDDVDELTDKKSATLSEKVQGILSKASSLTAKPKDEKKSPEISEKTKNNKKFDEEDNDESSKVVADSEKKSSKNATNRKKDNKNDMDLLEEEVDSASETTDSRVTIDALLREIAANHSTNDDCSYSKTLLQSKTPQVPNENSLVGKKIVFVGYFKNSISMQIQKLLSSKGYQTHVEQSKGGDPGESFVFCGPFRKEKNAEKLVKWLRKNDFTDARVVKISEESIEETLYDSANDESDLPKNKEKEIPEINSVTQRELLKVQNQMMQDQILQNQAKQRALQLQNNPQAMREVLAKQNNNNPGIMQQQQQRMAPRQQQMPQQQMPQQQMAQQQRLMQQQMMQRQQQMAAQQRQAQQQSAAQRR